LCHWQIANDVAFHADKLNVRRNQKWQAGPYTTQVDKKIYFNPSKITPVDRFLSVFFLRTVYGSANWFFRIGNFGLLHSFGF
jgi:hypothetical protein